MRGDVDCKGRASRPSCCGCAPLPHLIAVVCDAQPENTRFRQPVAALKQRSMSPRFCPALLPRASPDEIQRRDRSGRWVDVARGLPQPPLHPSSSPHSLTAVLVQAKCIASPGECCVPTCLSPRRSSPDVACREEVPERAQPWSRAGKGRRAGGVCKFQRHAWIT